MVTNHFCVTDITEMDIAVEMKAMTDLDVEVALLGSANNFHNPTLQPFNYTNQ